MVRKESIGRWEGKEIFKITLSNENGFSVGIINIGAAVHSVLTRDREGKLEDVVLGFDRFQDYSTDNSFIGVICGRYANRIAGASFELNGKSYSIGKNEGNNTLHGGISGFNRKIWEIDLLPEYLGAGVKMDYLSVDGEEGFPGNLKTTVTYALGLDNSLHIKYLAETDKATYINLTNHSYFNLSGCKSDVMKHELMLNADQRTETDAANIPTGKILSVKETAWDFTRAKPVGRDAIAAGGGYDHNFILLKDFLNKPAAILLDPGSGRKLECFTSEPAIQLYTANHFDGTQVGKEGIQYKKHFGLCLEAQHYPDSMHHATFPPVLLNPGKPYTQETIYRFSVA